MIWNESGDTVAAVNKYQKKCLDYFSDVNNIDNIDDWNEILQILMNAWNYFPHRSLGGKAPFEMFSAEVKNESKINEEKAMPKVIVGDYEMEWEEYETMLNEMEKAQTPFRDWIENDVLPKYEKYLQTVSGTKTANKHFEAADIFFERVLQVGFVKFEDIRKDFVQKEFPNWWQTYVLMNNLKEKAILSSLKKLFEFIEFTYNIKANKFGF